MQLIGKPLYPYSEEVFRPYVTSSRPNATLVAEYEKLH